MNKERQEQNEQEIIDCFANPCVKTGKARASYSCIALKIYTDYSKCLKCHFRKPVQSEDTRAYRFDAKNRCFRVVDE